MPFHQHNKNSLIGGGVVVSWEYTVRLVKRYTGAYPPLTLSLFFLFHYYPIHTSGVDTSNKSSTKKMVWEQNPIIMFFQSLPSKQENNKEYWDDKTHTSYEKEKHTQQEG